MSKIITCLMCHGAGFITQRDMDGTPRPVSCRACGGTGLQTVRP